MSGPWLVKLRTIIYADTFELVVTDRRTGECRVISLDDDQLAVLGWEFADALMQRHAHQKRLSRPQPDDIVQHQQAAE
jgi:hypothetical protein